MPSLSRRPCSSHKPYQEHLVLSRPLTPPARLQGELQQRRVELEEARAASSRVRLHIALLEAMDAAGDAMRAAVALQPVGEWGDGVDAAAARLEGWLRRVAAGAPANSQGPDATGSPGGGGRGDGTAGGSSGSGSYGEREAESLRREPVDAPERPAGAAAGVTARTTARAAAPAAAGSGTRLGGAELLGDVDSEAAAAAAAESAVGVPTSAFLIRCVRMETPMLALGSSCRPCWLAERSASCGEPPPAGSWAPTSWSCSADALSPPGRTLATARHPLQCARRQPAGGHQRGVC
jgi:hypothetical protein